ncbi:hypothetical protein [Chryseobacterium chendengshani]|uniref:hypothetical protein n=1 Tax=Chryseobacterium sp. LJ756 TaxID=2864113 RepID=UPI001C63C359|nr:hypothetical protein [Chryseobacterium sp. LJ756]MBW7675124.1 hypothetical protein [Chryseobacterium sp. LJ756]
MKARWRISFFLMVTVLVCLTFWNYKSRVYDWDMPGYIGTVYTWEFPDNAEKVRELTFSSIKKEAFDLHYRDLVGTSPIDKTRQIFEKNTQAFTEQLPYFQIKLGYNLVIAFFCKLGCSPPTSVLFVSQISYFFSCLLIFYILKILFPENYIISALITFGSALLPPMTYMSRVSTPDMFIFQFMLIFIIGIIKKWQKWLMFLLLFGITFIRPDYITFTLTYIFAIAFYSYFTEKKIDMGIIIQGTVLLLFYVSMIKYYNYPGWKDVFYDSFIYRRPIISAQPANFTLNDYLQIIYIRIIYFKKVTLSVLIMISIIFWLSKDLWIRTISLLFLINVYIKFFIFPQSAALRFFFPFIFPLFIMMLYAISKKYNGPKLNKIA